MKKELLVLLALTFCLLTACNKQAQKSSENKNTSEPQESVSVDTQAQAEEEIAEEIAEEESEEPQETVVENDVEETVEAEDVLAEESVSEPEQVQEQEQEPEYKPVQPAYVSVSGITLTVYDVTLSIGHKTMPIVTMQPFNATNKGEIWQSSDTSVATVDYLGNIKAVGEGICVVTVTSVDNANVSANVNVTVVPQPECTYIDGILIANKTYPLPESYAPGWDAEASEKLNVMFAEAKRDGIHLFVKSGYRSYIDQKIIYNGYVKRDGKEGADRYSARPGHSEHQTGLAFDLNSTANSFANTKEAAWIAANCYKYGFIVRYPKGKEDITGYIYEPWHVRYLGEEKAKQVYESGLCLEEFLGITSVYSY